MSMGSFITGNWSNALSFLRARSFYWNKIELCKLINSNVHMIESVTAVPGGLWDVALFIFYM